LEVSSPPSSAVLAAGLAIVVVAFMLFGLFAAITEYIFYVLVVIIDVYPALLSNFSITVFW
jgi:hypothetical protein